jgi:signal transduction histidine kinase/HD-like signal output (HDOD) protein
MQRIYLKDRSFAIDTLPSETGLLVELMDLCANEEATFEMFASAIRRDSGLTAQFLKLANSPLYRQWNEVTDLKRMLIVLGLQNVKKIIITSAVQNFFNKLAEESDSLIHRLWLRSLVCAHLAERLARKVNYRKPDEAYLAGLLHQIGILLLLVNYRENYQQVLEQYDDSEDYCELEQSNYGIDHCELGASMVESWQLDSLMSDAIRFQYATAEELNSSPVLMKLVATSRALASPPNIEADETDIENTERLLGLDQDSILECLADALDDSRKVLSELGFADDVSFAEATEENQTAKVRQQKELALAERIKNITLTYCFMNGDSQNTETLVKELRINFDLLFNQRQLLFITKTAEQLVPFNDLKSSKLDEISFSLKDPNSMIVSCFQKRQVLDSLQQKCSIADNQIVRVVGAECACFLPVFSGNENVGVLVIGSKRTELPTLKERLPLAQLLLAEIGKKYAALNTDAEPEESISLTDFNKIVHEVKNPLTIINNYLYILGRKLDEDHPAKEEINFIKEEMERVGAILAKARERDQFVSGAKNTDINKLLDELDSFFSNSIYREKSIRSNLDLETSIPVLRCSENKLKQVFINIIKNAVEAMDEAGTIEISTRDNCFQNGNQYVEIAIRDNGPGIPATVLRNLFKPVESTKKGHSGLGLSIVGDLINAMSGTISCYSSQGKGTEFKILLPRLTSET